MQINLHETTFSIAKNQAVAAGFSNVNDYITNLITHQQSDIGPSSNGNDPLSRAEALVLLRQLRQEVPKFSTDKIVDMVRESRADLP